MVGGQLNPEESSRRSHLRYRVLINCQLLSGLEFASMNRRTLLKSAGLLSLAYPLQRFYSLQTAPRFSSNPFAAGVASGGATRNGIVLWTRLIPDPTGERDWQRAAVAVNWEIASDERMQNVIRRGIVDATPALGHSVHVDATGPASNLW